jgi:hypothetical protein
LLAAAALYAGVAATTTPFTWPADVLTAVVIATVGLGAVLIWPARPRPLPERAGGHPYRLWLLLGAAVVALEVTEYLARGSRAAHPTLSSMTDALDRHQAAKAVVFLSWMLLGVAIVAAGRVRRPPAGGPPR